MRIGLSNRLLDVGPKKKRSRFSLALMVTVFASVTIWTIPRALAVPLPAADYVGIFNYSAATGLLEAQSTMSLVVYEDGSFTFDPLDDNILGATVDIATGTFTGYDPAGNALFEDGTFRITDASGTYLSADLVDIEIIPIAADPGIINPAFSGNLENVQFGSADPSRFIDELEPFVASSGGLAATRVVLDFFSFGPSDIDLTQDSWGNVQGKLTHVPEPSALFLLGSGLIGLWFSRQRLMRK